MDISLWKFFILIGLMWSWSLSLSFLVKTNYLICLNDYLNPLNSGIWMSSLRKLNFWMKWWKLIHFCMISIFFGKGFLCVFLNCVVTLFKKIIYIHQKVWREDVLIPKFWGWFCWGDQWLPPVLGSWVQTTDSLWCELLSPHNWHSAKTAEVTRWESFGKKDFISRK